MRFCSKNESDEYNDRTVYQPISELFPDLRFNMYNDDILIVTLILSL